MAEAEHVLSQLDLLSSGDIPWEKIKATNPEAYARLKGESDHLRQRIEHLRATRSGINSKHREAALIHAKQQFLEAFPDLQDTNAYDKFQDEIADFLENEMNYSSEETDNMADVRFAMLAKEAMEGRKLKAALKAAREKKIPLAPTRVQRPGTGDAEKSRNKEAAALHNKAKQSGRVSDLMKYVETII